MPERKWFKKKKNQNGGVEGSVSGTRVNSTFRNGNNKLKGYRETEPEKQKMS